MGLEEKQVARDEQTQKQRGESGCGAAIHCSCSLAGVVQIALDVTGEDSKSLGRLTWFTIFMTCCAAVFLIPMSFNALFTLSASGAVRLSCPFHRVVTSDVYTGKGATDKRIGHAAFLCCFYDSFCLV